MITHLPAMDLSQLILYSQCFQISLLILQMILKWKMMKCFLLTSPVVHQDAWFHQLMIQLMLQYKVLMVSDWLAMQISSTQMNVPQLTKYSYQP